MCGIVTCVLKPKEPAEPDAVKEPVYGSLDTILSGEYWEAKATFCMLLSKGICNVNSWLSNYNVVLTIW